MPRLERQALLTRGAVFVAFLAVFPMQLVPSDTPSEMPAAGPTVAPASQAAFDARTTALRIQKAVADRRYAEAFRELTRFAAAAPQLYLINNYDYLQARLLHRAGDLARARALYEQVMQRPGGQIFAPYCLKYLAELARREAQSGNRLAIQDEQRRLVELTQRFGTHPAAHGARLRLAESYATAGQLDRAVALYRQLAPQRREYEARLGVLLRQAGQEAEARQLFQRLLAAGKDDAALLAVEQLDAKGETDLPPDKRLARARLYLANRHAEGATRHFRALVEHIPAVPERAEALWSLGRAFFIEENWEEAIRWWARAHEEYPTSPEGEKSYYQVGHALQNAGRYHEAVARYEAFIAAYPNSEFLGGAHLNAIDALRSAGDFKAALEWCDRTEKRFPREPAGITARFQRAKILMSKGDWRGALGALDRLRGLPLQQRGPGATNTDEVTFLRGLCLERLERFEEAIEAYLSLPDTRTSYYGQQATEQLLALAKNPKAQAWVSQHLSRFRRQGQSKDALHQGLRLTSDPEVRRALLSRLETVYRQLPAYARFWQLKVPEPGRGVILRAESAPARRSLAEELCFLGLYEDALPFLETGAGQALAQAVYASRGNQAWKALAYSEPTFAALPADFRLEIMPRLVAELLYPAPYRDELSEQAQQCGIDPRLLLAIARQESRFNPGVKSPVGARGMFQFIAATAEQVAQKLSLPGVTPTDLYEPRVAAQFAARYVADLFAMFPNHPAAVVAAYNGGETAVARWLARAGADDKVRFASEVGYAETKDYVFKVMTNYRCYQQLFDEHLRPLQRRP
ncbi:MAG: transglycosylase SLT domain-containing protein [Acidobacteriota bacterium]